MAPTNVWGILDTSRAEWMMIAAYRRRAHVHVEMAGSVHALASLVCWGKLKKPRRRDACGALELGPTGDVMAHWFWMTSTAK